MNNKFLYTPKYFDMLVSSTGQLSGEKRYQRIMEIGQKNIWLAARCKNTCVKEEPKVVDWIILRCSALYNKFGDLQSLAALFELREYGVLGILLGLKSRKIHHLVRNRNVSFSDAFAVFIDLIDIGLGLKLFSRFVELGYVLDLQVYNNLLAKVKSSEDVEVLTSQMSLSGIDANAETYFYLIKKDTTFQSAFSHFTRFEALVDFNDQNEMVKEAYSALFGKTESFSDLSMVKERCLKEGFIFNDVFDVSQRHSLAYAYHLAAIRLSNEPEEAEMYFNTFTDIVLKQENIVKLDTAAKQKQLKRMKGMVAGISSMLLFRLSKLLPSFEAFFQVLKNLISYLENTLVVSIPIQPYGIVITQVIFRERSFAKGKQMLELFPHLNKKIFQTCMEPLFSFAKKKEEIDYVLDNMDCLLLEPKSIVALMKRIDNDTAAYLFERLKKEGYPLNTFIYNAFIKNCSFQQSLQLIEQMRDNGVTPDVQTIQPVLRKWNSMHDLETILILAKELKIEADDKTVLAIGYRAKDLKQETDLIDFSYENELMFCGTLSHSWKQAIIKASNALIG